MAKKRTKFQIRSDAAKLRWHVRDDEKEAFWRGHIGAWRKSGLSKLGYCRQHNLAYSSFGAWSREIELRDREHDRPTHVAALLPQPEPAANPFVPIRLVQSPPAQEGAQQDCTKSEGIQQIEIVLPGGAVMRLPDNWNATFVANLLSALKA